VNVGYRSIFACVLNPVAMLFVFTITTIIMIEELVIQVYKTTELLPINDGIIV
jgi:hypothetical protein